MNEWDWPPRLMFEEQQFALYEHAQRWIRFGPSGLSATGRSVFDIYPRPLRQTIYRAYAR